MKQKQSSDLQGFNLERRGDGVLIIRDTWDTGKVLGKIGPQEARAGVAAYVAEVAWWIADCLVDDIVFDDDDFGA